MYTRRIGHVHLNSMLINSGGNEDQGSLQSKQKHFSPPKESDVLLCPCGVHGKKYMSCRMNKDRQLQITVEWKGFVITEVRVNVDTSTFTW